MRREKGEFVWRRYLALLTASIARTSFSMFHFAMIEITYTLKVYNFMNNITLDVEYFLIFPKTCRHLGLVLFLFTYCEPLA